MDVKDCSSGMLHWRVSVVCPRAFIARATDEEEIASR
jgi:hypothetical protein